MLATLLVITWIIGFFSGLVLGRWWWSAKSAACIIPPVPEVFATIQFPGDGKPFSPANRCRIGLTGHGGTGESLGRLRQRGMATGE